MNKRTKTILGIGILVLVLTACQFPFSPDPPTPFFSPTPNLTMTALFSPDNIATATPGGPAVATATPVFIASATPPPTDTPLPLIPTDTPPPPTATPVSQGPFNGPHNIPGRIPAEDFDTGGPGVAYSDTSAVNYGDSTYRNGEGVDIKTISGVSDNGLAVGRIGHNNIDATAAAPPLTATPTPTDTHTDHWKTR